MKRSVLLLLLPFILGAGYRNPPPPEPSAPSVSEQTQGQQQGQTQGQRQAQDQGQRQAQNQSAISEGSTAMVTQGDTDVALNASPTTNVSTDYKRNAPAVMVNSSPSTAEYMVCFGLGGSGTEGAATGAWCWLQKDLYAEHRANRYAAMGLYEQAAEAYCDRKIHRRDFGGVEECRTHYLAALDQPTPVSFILDGIEGQQPIQLAHNEEEVAQLQRENRRLVETLERIERRVAEREERQEEERKRQEEKWQESLDKYAEKRGIK